MVSAKGTRTELKAPTVSRTPASTEATRGKNEAWAKSLGLRAHLDGVPFALTPDAHLARSTVLVSAKGTRELDSERLVGIAS